LRAARCKTGISPKSPERCGHNSPFREWIGVDGMAGIAEYSADSDIAIHIYIYISPFCLCLCICVCLQLRFFEPGLPGASGCTFSNSACFRQHDCSILQPERQSVSASPVVSRASGLLCTASLCPFPAISQEVVRQVVHQQIGRGVSHFSKKSAGIDRVIRTR
jgi:hypothetical protein